MANLLKYRFGFFGHIEGACENYGNADVLGEWVKKKYGKLTIFVHPETTIRHVGGRDKAVLVIGSIYSVGNKSVDTILKKMLAEGVDSIGHQLDDVSGRFALFYNNGSGWRVYHDAFGSRSMFYSPDRRGVISSHAGLFADVFQLTPNDDTLKFTQSPIYKSRTVKYLPGDLTCWSRVYAVIPNNYLSLSESKLYRYWPVVPKKETTFEEFSYEFDRHIKGLLNEVKRLFLLVGITGGIDSRAVFAAMIRYGIPFNGVTWLGGYVEEKELGSIAEIVKTFKIPHKKLAISDAYSLPIAKLAAINSGSYRGPSRLVAKMHRSYFKQNGTFIRGYGGEIIRGFYNTFSKPMKDFTPKEMMRTFGSSNRATAVDAYYDKFGEKMFGFYGARGNYAGLTEFGYDCSDIFYWEHRMGMWGSAMLNEMDCAIYSLVGMNGRKLYETALGLPAEDRLSKKILARISDAYSQTLAQIKYF